MSQKTTSLDIQKGKGSRVDISTVFPMVLTRTLDLARHGQFIDSMSIVGERTEHIDIHKDTIIHINRFRTIEMLDLVLPEVVDSNRLQQGLLRMISRPRKIDLVLPLYIPYGALDIRLDRQIPRSRIYPDLFARPLPMGLLTRRMIKGTRMLITQHRKQIALTVIGLLVISIPVLSYVAYSLNHGYSTLENLVGVRNPDIMRLMIRSARGEFERSSFLFAPFSWIPLDRIDSVQRAARGGLALSRGLDIIAQALPTNVGTGSTVLASDASPLSYRPAARDIFPLESLGITNPTDWIVANMSMLKAARDEFISAGSIYSGVIPSGERTIRMQKIGKTISSIANLLDWSLKNDKTIENMLGHTNPQRYIVFNQNRDEIRANGGFPGSILSFTFYKGNILDYHGDDVYYYDWNLYPYKEIPPPGIALLTGNYGLRDVNYYPDFHDTLEKANTFIERSGDATVTTAIAIHQGIVEEILKKTGPITVSGVTIPFDNHNFSLLMSTLVENKYAQTNTPKDILFQFGTALIAQIHQNNLTLDVINITRKYIQDGEILFASRDSDIDAFLTPYKKKLPWELSSPNWIYPVWTSVSGNKSDRYISHTYAATVKKLENCKYENTITLTNKHSYSQKDSEELQSYFKIFAITDSGEQAKLNFIQGNGKNRSYVRVYVPLGATIVGTGSDIESVTKDYATVFSTLIETPVGTTTTKNWKYTIDIPNCDSYDGYIEWTRQPGLREVVVK